MAQRKILTVSQTKYRDCTGQEFIMHINGDSHKGVYTNRPGKPDFTTNAEQVRKQLFLERWEEI